MYGIYVKLMMPIVIAEGLTNMNLAIMHTS